MANFWQKLKKPIIGLAPMYGVTDGPMRQIQVSIAKPDVIYTEFIRTEFLLVRPEKAQKALSFKENQRPIVAQIYGSCPESFYLAVKKLIPFGFDGIDINIGCPRPSATKTGGGAALIGNFALVEAIVKNCLKAIGESDKEISLSVKTRIRKSNSENKEWFTFLGQFSLSAVAVHGRYFAQGLSGSVDWFKIREAAEVFKRKGIICLGNGGIKSLEEACRISQKYCLDGVLIGRAAIGNPWFFNGSKPSLEERFKIIVKHSRMAERFYGQRGFFTVLKHLKSYCRGFDRAKQLRVELMQAENSVRVEQVIKNFK